MKKTGEILGKTKENGIICEKRKKTVKIEEK